MRPIGGTTSPVRHHASDALLWIGLQAPLIAGGGFSPYWRLTSSFRRGSVVGVRLLPIMEPLLDKMTRHLNPTRVAIAGVCSIFFSVCSIFFKRFGLTLMGSVAVEAVFCIVAIFGGGDLLATLWWCFHYPAYLLMFGWLDPDTGGLWQAILWFLFMFSAAVFQWWLIILAGSWIFRQFRRKRDHAA